ncbi:hypothetical protein [Nakamurella endophytica]|uniref:Uncharacterized protein n=1 Tax=Nakamurella endophytica TaxID=1748367 RepID=A0A917WIM2_9ACTN|nr:hypothetical protein [Nakamurella endophytica]GGM07806.1 hypothetical protein GCM10011594_29730 [Nakamurella endophytica]
MRLRDAFRSRRGDDDPDEGSGPVDVSAIEGDESESASFQPRTDGDYIGEVGSAGRLRFLPGGRVQYRPDGAAGSEPWPGEYTPAGRFSVQQRFERPITFTVLSSSADAFTARRTDTRDRSADTLGYRFEPPTAG